MDSIYLKANNEQSWLASSPNYRDVQRRQTEVPKFFVLYTSSLFCLVLRRILCGGFRKCFGLVVLGRRSTDGGRQALFSITDGLCSVGQSHKAGTCHVF